MVTFTIVAVVLFVLLLWVLHRATTQQLRREAVPGARVRVNARGFAALALAIGAFWVALCGGALLAVYQGVHPMLLSLGIVVLLAAARPRLAPRIHPFVIRPGDDDPTTHKAGMRRDDAAVYAEHRAAIARGEQRALRWTVTGEPYSYAKDEHVAPGDDRYNLRSLSVGIPVAVGYACAAVLIAGLVVGQLVRGEPLNWVLLIGVVAFIVTGRPAFVFCRDEFRASRIRKKRGVPRPDRAQEIQLSDVDGPGAALIDLRKRPEKGLQG
ncbi:hypothetical protein KKR91_01920 [Arthrobacter jiangjiafuii]|uniref:Uncharacterized protein n=1 Tax=Arthrobacter jiangjiafuii TaxID=2817475 RepID=A0A975M5U0_9MICC|nr:hypothetical protein [Arthrobacter jiangjiafuii]MBP3044732.1 hypothetical protein [Arthrobacter jiangjiafuii]QWC10437.1 hypothetical protein KKR91_01920 [Arthrobacter jiangjiafuii]